MTYFMTPKVTVTFVVGLTSLRPQKVTGSLEVAVTYFMTPKVNLTFDLDLDLGHDPKRSRGHKRSR